jgi:hypothetical protein
VSPGPYKQIVEGQQSLLVAELNLGQRHGSRCARFAVQQSRNDRLRLVGQEGQQHTIETFGIGVDSDNRLIAGVLGYVCHQAILPQRHHDIVPPNV